VILPRRPPPEALHGLDPVVVLVGPGDVRLRLRERVEDERVQVVAIEPGVERLHDAVVLRRLHLDVLDDEAQRPRVLPEPVAPVRRPVVRAEARARGVISLSAGNHAQALAWGAASLGIQATIVMPRTAQQSKIDATRGYGGEVVLTEGDLLETCLTLQRERDLTLIHPFDDPRVIAGQGTVGMELVDDVPNVDVVVVACGGGGLISGVAAAVKQRRSSARVIGVEPEGASAMSQSVARGTPVRLERIDTIADGLAAPFAGRLNLAHVQAFVDHILLVSDREIVEALGTLIERCKIVPEPAGAAALAPLLTGALTIEPGANVAVIICGGNIDRQRLKALL